MAWVFAVIIVMLIGAVAVVASGRAGDDYGMAEEYDDRPDVRVQADGPLTAADLREVRFSTVVRGYRASEVDALLDRLAVQLDRGSGASAAPPADPGLPEWAPRDQHPPPTGQG